MKIKMLVISNTTRPIYTSMPSDQAVGSGLTQVFLSSLKFLVGFYVAPTYGDFLALLVEEDLKCPSVHISGTNRHLKQ
jgi:hypothetical protein